MATSDDLLAEARQWIGTVESPAGSNRQTFSLILGRLPEPWCADFVVYVARKVGITLPSESAYTPTMAQGFVNAGAWHRGAAGAAPGDVVFFDFPDSSTGIQHVGIVERVNADGSLVTIEGNTSSGSFGSQDNGGGVFRRTRPTAYVVGYGRPAFTMPTPANHTETVPIPVHDFEEGAVKQTMIHVGKLDENGNGWADWNPGLGRDPNIIGLVLLGPSPPDDNYWPQQANVTLSAQPRGGVVRVTVRNGTPGDTVTAFVTVS